MNNKSLLVVIILMLCGILGITLIQANEKTHADAFLDSFTNTIEEMAGDAESTLEEAAS